jgi:hypothetical protein
MKKRTKPMKDKPTKPDSKHMQRGVGVVELLIATSTLGAALLVGVLSTPKLPPSSGD